MDTLKKSKRRKSLPGEALKELQALVDALPLDPVQKILAEHARHSTSELDRGLLSIPLEERRLRGISARTAEERQQKTAEQDRMDASLHASESRYRQHEIGQEALMRKAARVNAEALADVLTKAGLAVKGNSPAGTAPGACAVAASAAIPAHQPPDNVISDDWVTPKEARRVFAKSITNIKSLTHSPKNFRLDEAGVRIKDTLKKRGFLFSKSRLQAFAVQQGRWIEPAKEESRSAAPWYDPKPL